MTEACDLSALAARRLIGRKRLSPVELVDSCIARIEATNGRVNAMVATRFDRARAEARAAERAVTRGDPLGLLHGLPVGIKDLEETEGLRTTFGSPIFAKHVPRADDPHVAALRAAGAIVLGKTNTPEFGAGGNTVNPVYGATGNPFDPARIAGGSSGGSAAALALGMVPLATGSDTGGSLRTPAAYCGVASLRPSPGLVPSARRPLGWTTFGVLGPMARGVDDCALMLAAMAAGDRLDPLSGEVDPAPLARVPEIDLARLRVAVSEDLGFAPVSRTIRATFGERVERLAPSFSRCVRADPDLGEAARAFWALRAVLFLAAFGDHYRQHPELLGPNVRGNIEAGLGMSATEVAFGHAEQTRVYRRMHAFLEDHDVLICPAVSVPAFPVERLYCEAIDGEPMRGYMDWLGITYGLTLAAVPVAVIPCGRDATGLPFGIQIAGPRGADRFVLGVAAALERHLAADPSLARPIPPPA